MKTLINMVPGATYPNTINYSIVSALNALTQVRAQFTGKVGFNGAIPISTPGTYIQEYTTTSRTVNAYTSNPQGTTYAGIASGVAGTPYAQVSDLNSLRAAYENLRLMSEDIFAVLNQLIDDLRSYGLIG